MNDTTEKLEIVHFQQGNQNVWILARITQLEGCTLLDQYCHPYGVPIYYANLDAAREALARNEEKESPTTDGNDN